MSSGEFTDLESSVLKRITEDRWVQLAGELIRTGQPRSTNPLDPDLPGAEEEAFAMLLVGKLQALGMSVDTHESAPHRPNVVARLAGSGEGPSLMINDHLDTYPAVEPHKWTKTGHDPFRPTRHADRLYARGTSDTRGNLASCLLAAQALHEAGVRLKGDLIYCFSADEERNGTHGSIYLSKEIGVTADYAIVAEPTAWGSVDSGDWGMNLSVANAGHCLVEVTVSGTKSHIWRPDISVNAIVEAARLIPRLRDMTFMHVPAVFMGHTPPCASIVRIRGGLPGEMQFSPDTCTITLAVVGLVPGMTIEGVLADIQATSDDALKGSDTVTASIRQVPGSLFVAATDPLPIDDEPCLSLRQAYRRLMDGREPQPNRKNAFNDTIRWREAGIKAVTFGPGEDGWDVDNESISITKSVVAAKIYALTIMHLLGVRAL